MRIAFVVESVPNLHGGGGGVTAYAMMLGLLENFHCITVFTLTPFDEHNIKHKQHLENLGVTVVSCFDEDTLKKPLLRKLRMLLFPSIEDVIPSIAISAYLAERIDRQNYDAVIGYHWESLGAMVKIQSKKIGIVGDPINLSWRYRRTTYAHLDDQQTIKSMFFNFLHSFTLEKAQKNAMIYLLNKMDYTGAFAAHHAAELEELAGKVCNYMKTPVPRVERKVYEKPLKFKILLLGHLYGISTLSGIELYLDEIHPYLNNLIGEPNFDVDIVGGNYNTLPQRLKNIIEREKNIHIRGHIVPPDEVICTAHILLVPTPIELGIRVRIITGMQYGAFVVAHAANKKGIPEMIDEENAIIGKDAVELSEQIQAIYENYEKYREIPKTAYKTYEENFTPSMFFKQLSEWL